MVKRTHSLKVSRKLWNQIWSPGRYKSLLTLQAVLPLTRMGAVRRLVLLALLIVPCLAELNSTESEGKKIEPVVSYQNRETSFQGPPPKVFEALISANGLNTGNVHLYAVDVILN